MSFYRQVSGPDRANWPSARRVEPQTAPMHSRWNSRTARFADNLPFRRPNPAFGATAGKFVRPAEKDAGSPRQSDWPPLHEISAVRLLRAEDPRVLALEFMPFP